MNKKIIVINGHLAAGKSTFALKLSKTVNIPYFIKDTFKTALCTSVPVNSKEESNRFSTITFDAIMYVAERFMETGHPVIIEGNFVPAGMKPVNEAAVIQALIEKYDYQPLTYKFAGDTKVLYERYAERDKSPERGQANRDYIEVTYDIYDKYCQNLYEFNIGGKAITVDTTDFTKVDFDSLVETARQFINCPTKE